MENGWGFIFFGGKTTIFSIKKFIFKRGEHQTWKSKISESRFIKKHLSRAATWHPPLKKLVINHLPSCFRLQNAFSCPFSSISNQPIEDTTDLICYDVKLEALCDELWCVEVKESLFLWNPSMRTYRKLPKAPVRLSWVGDIDRMLILIPVYGMGYDVVGDDYKVVKISFVHKHLLETELYSLRSDSWRKIQSFPGNSLSYSNCEFVNGALNWMVHHCCGVARSSVIISFDLSTEKYEEVDQPKYSPTPSSRDTVEVTVLKGMLCVFLNYMPTAFVLWMMKDYGVEESWTKIYDIDYSCIPPITPKHRLLKPLYLYENGEVLIWVQGAWEESKIAMYKNEQTIAREIVAGSHCSGVNDGFVYVESLISPAMW
ncbi:hypothetical protein Pfo_022289 [Paulownia fortunei]|nr:hypothetical protein Pfo_022289 [Paulownia fortunei]